MATNALSRLLKKKKLTGEEVGKIILLDLVNSYKNQPELSQQERDAYVDALVENKDIRAYNDYLQVYRFIITMIIDYESQERAYHALRQEFLSHMLRYSDAENNYFKLSLHPRILTRRDYEQALKEAKENVSSWTYSLYSLVAYELRKNIEAYNNKEKTPYKRYFDAYKKEQANQQAIKTYRATYDNPKKDEDLTKLVMLDKYIDIYDDAELETKGGMLFFKEDYPELLQDILENYSKLEGLEYLTKLPESEYLKEDLIDFETAYKLDIMGAKQDYDDPLLTFKGSDLRSGVAVIESARGIAKGNIIDGTFYYDLGKGANRNLAEDILGNEKYISNIERIKSQFKQIVRSLVAFRYFMDKLVEITGVPELLAFSRDDGTGKIPFFKAYAEDLWVHRYGLLEDEGDPVELGKQVRQLFSLGFTAQDVEITTEEETEVERIISNATSKEKAAIDTFNYLVTGAK